MADGRVVIETEVDAGGIKSGVNKVNQELDQIGKNVPKNGARMVDAYGNEIDSLGRRIRRTYQGTSKEAQAMSQEMQTAFRAQSVAMRGSRDDMIKVQHGYFKMAQGSKAYVGTNKQFMQSVTQMGAEHKRVTESMMKSNDLAKMSFFQSVGQMVNMSTQASKISDNYDRMANPLLKVNKAGLAVADSLNKIALRGQPAAQALKMLGPTANMKQLNDMTAMIGQGLMRFQMIAVGAAIANVLMFKGLHNAAKETATGYEDAFNRMKKTVRQAFQPMVEVFAMIMKPIYEFITAMAEMAIKFNEAHPLLAKMIQGFMMLVPVLTLLLSPLAIGIGLFGGMSAAFAALWTFIGPVITGMAAMSATVYIVGAAIVVLIGSINHLWKTNEAFRNAIIGAWDAIRSKAQEVFGWLGSFLSPIISGVLETLTSFATKAMELIKQAFTGDFSGITSLFQQLIPSLIGFLVGGLPGLLIAGSRFIPMIVQGIQSNSASFATTATNLINQFVQFITTALPKLIQQGVTILQNLVMGIVQALPVLIEAVSQILNFIVSTITTLLPVLLQAGVTILTAILNAIITNLPILLDAGLQIITTLVNAITTLLPVLLEAGLQIIMGLVQAIVTNLPLILDAALQIIMTLIDGIIQVLPTLIPVAMQIITTLVDMIVVNLPLILQAGIDILLMLIQGIVQILPQLITTGIQLITEIANAIATQLPVILQAGVDLVTQLIAGLVQMLPEVVVAIGQLMLALLNAIIENGPAILEAGVTLITALMDGMNQMYDAVIQILVQLGSDILGAISDVDLFGVGQDIINGLIEGINSMAGEALRIVEDLADKIMGATAKFFGVASPSKRMRDEVGKHLPTGIAVGVKANTGAAVKAMQGLGNEMMMKTPRNFASSMSRNGSIARPQSQAIGSQKIEIISMMDSEVLGRAVVPVVNNRQQQQATIKNFMQGGKN